LYEQAQTRFIPRQNRWYNLSTHYPWIGMRTAHLDGAHVEYFRGISNPVAVKVGTAMDPSWLQGLVTTLNPQNQPGRLTLIHRFSERDVEPSRPGAIGGVKATGQRVLWVCDPMHGNTEPSRGGLKTRRFENILKELDLAFRIHAEMGSYLGGGHIELTGDDVTECTGGARGLTDSDLQRAYRSQVDPRLNHEQALELAMLIAERSQTTRANRRAGAELDPPRAPSPRGPRATAGPEPPRAPSHRVAEPPRAPGRADRRPTAPEVAKQTPRHRATLTSRQSECPHTSQRCPGP